MPTSVSPRRRLSNTIDRPLFNTIGRPLFDPFPLSSGKCDFMSQLTTQAQRPRENEDWTVNPDAIAALQRMVRLWLIHADLTGYV